MAEQNETAATEQPVCPSDEASQPKLPEHFFEMLLNPPACKTLGVCDGCGRCER